MPPVERRMRLSAYPPYANFIVSYGSAAAARQPSKLPATKSQLTRFQNASMYFGRALR